MSINILLDTQFQRCHLLWLTSFHEFKLRRTQVWWLWYGDSLDRKWVSSVQFSHSVVSDSLWPHESHHAMPPYPSPTPGVHSNSCPSSRWCHPSISFSVVPFSSCPQSLLASESFPISWLFVCIRWPKYWSFSLSISPSSEYSGLISFRIDWFDHC